MKSMYLELLFSNTNNW